VGRRCSQPAENKSACQRSTTLTTAQQPQPLQCLTAAPTPHPHPPPGAPTISPPSPLHTPKEACHSRSHAHGWHHARWSHVAARRWARSRRPHKLLLARPTHARARWRRRLPWSTHWARSPWRLHLAHGAHWPWSHWARSLHVVRWHAHWAKAHWTGSHWARSHHAIHAIHAHWGTLEITRTGYRANSQNYLLNWQRHVCTPAMQLLHV
jgi:hypothetical protein